MGIYEYDSMAQKKKDKNDKKTKNVNMFGGRGGIKIGISEGIWAMAVAMKM